MELEVDRCDHQVSDIESTNNRLKLDLDAANAALDKKEKLLQVKLCLPSVLKARQKKLLAELCKPNISVTVLGAVNDFI